VARRVNAVIRKRLRHIRSTFADAGFTGDELEIRARLFVSYEPSERLLFRNRSKEEARRLMVQRCKLLLDLD
jgi:hypothetical protein